MRCLDRNGKTVSGYQNPTGLLGFLYNCAAGRFLLKGLIRPGLSKAAGAFLDTRASKLLIAPFVRKNGIDMTRFEPGPFPSFNAFFRRKLKDDVHMPDEAPSAVVSPCDGKAQVFPVGPDLRFEIKGISYTVGELTGSEALEKRFAGGTLVLLRLSVDDYHRYAYPVGGIEGPRVKLGGVLHTVDPFAAERRPIYRENCREYALIDTEDAGSVLMMEVGALMVGRIRNGHPTGPVRRGEEKGFFEFGASTIILLFEKDAVTIDADLIRNTKQGAETAVRRGTRIGVIRKGR